MSYRIEYRLIGYDRITARFAVAVEIPTPLLPAVLEIADPQLPAGITFVDGVMSMEQVTRIGQIIGFATDFDQFHWRLDPHVQVFPVVAARRMQRDLAWLRTRQAAT